MPIRSDRQGLARASWPQPRDGSAPAPATNPTASDSWNLSASGAAMLGEVNSGLQNSFLYRQYGYTPPTIHLGKYGALWLRLHLKLVKPGDPLIAKDPARAATTAAASSAGQPVTWADVRGALNPGIWLPAWIPVGPVGAQIGFSADASVGFSVLSPYSHKLGRAVHNLTFKPPVSARRALALTPGTQVAIEGRGRVAIDGGVSGGNSFLPVNGPLTVGVSYGVDSYVSREATLDVSVERLEGQNVRVTISRAATRGKGDVASVRVGVHSNLGRVVPKVSGIAGVGERFLIGQISGQIERWLSLDASQIYATSDTQETVASFELDLSRPDAARAYDALMALDTRPAAALARHGASTGVWEAHLTSTIQTTTSGTDAHLGPIELLKDRSQAKVVHDDLQTRRGLMTVDAGTVDASHSDILTRWWSGRRKAQSEIVTANSPGTSQSTTTWHLDSDLKVDGWTSASNVRKFFLTAGALGVTTPQTAQALADKAFLDSFGATEMVLDASLTTQGLARVLSASPLDVQEAYSQAYESLDRPFVSPTLFGHGEGWRVSPWLKTDDPRYPTVMKLLAEGPQIGESGRDNRSSSNSARYCWITGRDLGQDSEAYKESLKFSTLIARLRGARSPVELSAILAANRGDFSSDDRIVMDALGRLAGPGGVSVHQASLDDRDHHKTFDYVQRGAFADPQTAVQAQLANPAGT